MYCSQWPLYSACFFVARGGTTCQVMKLLGALDLQPSRAAMDGALDQMDWGSIKAVHDVFLALFRAAFR